MDNTPVVEVKNLETTFQLKTGPFRAVNNISYSIHRGKTLGIVGESGCGKSVTSFSLMRLIENPGRVSGGQVLLQGRDLLKLSEAQMQDVRGGEMAMIFQEPMTALNPVLTIGYQLDEQIMKHKKCSAKEAKDRAIEMLSLVGIPSPEQRYHSYPHQLSGGMRQRAMIAMALSCDPQFLIADEPTTALDVTIQAQILNLMKEIQSQTQSSIIFITHDLGVVAGMADRVAVMYAGKIVEVGTVEEVFYNPQHPYTWGLLNSMPTTETASGSLESIPGTPPDLLNPPVGDAFAARNAYALDIDFEEQPPMFQISDSHYAATWLLDERAPEITPPLAILKRWEKWNSKKEKQ
jgi:oligopeptide transport system ATP-binding protein